MSTYWVFGQSVKMLKLSAMEATAAHAVYAYVMYNALCEYKNMENNCFLITIQHNNTDIIDITTNILNKTQKLIGGVTCNSPLTSDTFRHPL